MSDTAKKTAIRVECPPYQLLCRLTGKARATRDAVYQVGVTNCGVAWVREARVARPPKGQQQGQQQGQQRDPAARSDAEILLLYSGVHAILAYRVAHKLYLSGHPLSARTVSQLARFMTGIEIHPAAQIGKGLFIDHGMGVVIGETTEIGDNCTLYQGVTLGGTGKDCGKRHPTLGNNVLVGCGAKVLGPLTIADNCKIAAGAVVLTDIPENSTAVGIPARIVRRHGRKVDDLDQVHIPDPVAQELRKLRKEVNDLKKQVASLHSADSDDSGGRQAQE